MGNLTARQAATAKAGRHSDGDGLILHVSPGGRRRWILRYQIAKRRHDMPLGSLEDVSLAQARAKASTLRALVRQGIDPRQAEPEPPVPQPTFTQAAARFIRSKRRAWSNRKHARQWASTLRTYAKPVIGAKAVDTICTDDVLAILQPIWATKTETAKRVQGRLESVLDFAGAMQWTDGSNPARWRGHLDKLLASPMRVKRQAHGGVSRHHPAMPYGDVPGFVRELRTLTSVSACALELLILTATRTSEVLLAQWSEIDLEAAVWTIPASRMKAKREHRVPLSEAATGLLGRLPRVPDNPYVFPGARRGKPLSNMALLMVMRGMGYGAGGERGDYVPHGFRSSFRDWAGEVSSFPNHVCEMALAHTIESRAEAAYRRGDLFLKRRSMMAEWAHWCSKGGADAPIDLRARRAATGAAPARESSA